MTFHIKVWKDDQVEPCYERSGSSYILAVFRGETSRSYMVDGDIGEELILMGYLSEYFGRTLLEIEEEPDREVTEWREYP
ncbi:MAG: hypothetical protein V3V32_04540 [Dehalococcoidia bacterium]